MRLNCLCEFDIVGADATNLTKVASNRSETVPELHLEVTVQNRDAQGGQHD